MIMNALNKLDYLNMLFEVPYIHSETRSKALRIKPYIRRLSAISIHFHGDVSKDISSIFKLS